MTDSFWKKLLQLLAAAAGAAGVAAVQAAWPAIEAVLTTFGAEWLASGRLEGIVAYVVTVAAVFLGGFLVRKLPKQV